MDRTDIIVATIIMATLVILCKVDKTYEKIADKKMWYMYDKKKKKRIYY